MDNQKIGAFIAELRKAKNMSQKDLADKIGVTDKAISKWECGRGLPEISIMKSLCEILDINLNELLNGGKLAQSDIPQKSEQQLLTLLSKSQIKSKSDVIWITSIFSLFYIISIIFYVVIHSQGLFDTLWILILSSVLLAVGTIMLVVGIWKASLYYCEECQQYFRPTLWQFLCGYHFFGKRCLPCPNCRKKKLYRHIAFTKEQE